MTDLSPAVVLLEERRALLEGGPDSVGELQRRRDEAQAALDVAEETLAASEAELSAIEAAIDLLPLPEPTPEPEVAP